MDEALLDTDILSEVLKARGVAVLANSRQYLLQHQRFAFSAFSLYEIVRGLQSSRATRQLNQFMSTVSTSDVFPVSVSVLMRAAELWSQGRATGRPHGDADLIIAATAVEQQRVLVTGNTAHFSWINGLQIADWRVALP